MSSVCGVVKVALGHADRCNSASLPLSHGKSSSGSAICVCVCVRPLGIHAAKCLAAEHSDLPLYRQLLWGIPAPECDT